MSIQTIYFLFVEITIKIIKLTRIKSNYKKNYNLKYILIIVALICEYVCDCKKKLKIIDPLTNYKASITVSVIKNRVIVN